MRRIEDIDFNKIDLEPYKKDIEELNKMVDELWQDEEIRKIYVRQQISDIQKDFKDIKEYYVDIAQKTQSNWNSLREFIQEAKNCYFESIGTQILLNKMNELEGKDKK